MKTLSVVCITIILLFFGYLAFKGGKIEDMPSSISMHPSNFYKEPIAQIEKLKNDANMNIPNYFDLKKECDDSDKS